MQRLKKVKIQWSGAFAYAIGLLTSDGNLSKDGRHIDFTSKDQDLVETFKRCLKIDNKIGMKARGQEREKKYFKVSFGDVNFYQFLVKIGLHPAKSKTLKKLQIEERYFGDFFRGCIDGDGNIDVFKHPESSLPQVKLRLVSASLPFLLWVKEKIAEIFKVDRGWICQGKSIGELCYGKKDSFFLLKKIYGPNKPSLLRKYAIVQQLLKE